MARTQTGRVLAIYAVSRIVSILVFWLAWQRFDREDYPIPADASFPEFLARAWDGRWYAAIAEEGYPDELPRNADGEIRYSAWAFFPLYPMLARLMMRLTGLPWEVVGPTLSIVLGGVAMVVLARLLVVAAPRLVEQRPSLPYTAVAGMSFFPAAGVFTMAYSDSLALLLILSTLWAVCTRRYGLALVPVLLLGFTRAVALPMACVVVWHFVHRWRAEGWRAIDVRDRWKGALLAVTAVASGFSWMAVVGVALGSPDAYVQAQTPWRAGPVTAAPFSGWTWFIETWVGWAVLAALAVGVAAVVLGPFVRALGPEIQAWAGAYTAFLVAATALGPSTPRYVLLTVALPLGLVRAGRGFRGDLLVIATYAVLMVGWIHLVCLVKGFTA